MNDSKPAVLMVDDAEANLIALEALLEKLPCTLVRASSGNEALRLLLKRDFAVMLLDVQMPAMNGYEVARYARDNPNTNSVPIIFVTAMHEAEENALRGYGAGAVDFLFKPINPDILCSKVRVFLELYTNRKRLADEIEEHHRTLADLEAFNYSISHDLRAPLRPISGFSEALLEDYGDKLDSTAKGYLERINSGASRMSRLIEDLLQFARMGRAFISMGSVDLSALAGEILNELKEQDPARNVECVVVPDAKCEGDARLLRVVLENLLRNAWKFTQKREKGRIELGRLEGAAATFFIKDNGAGFDPQMKDKLFQPFRRLHAEQDFEGTGIGLAIVRRIVDRHKGRVWADAAVGEGATFYFTLNESA